MNNNDNDKPYNKGMECYKNGDYKNAREWLLLASNDPIYKIDALNMLGIVEISASNYLKARSILEENRDILYFEHADNYGILDMKEYNYNRALEEIIDSFSNVKVHPKKIMYLAECYMQLGEYDLARKIYETLQTKSDYYVIATLNLIYLNILEKNYSYAKRLFQNIKEDEISRILYFRINNILDYFNNNLKNTKSNQYYIKRLLRDNDNDLIEHLKRHIGENNAINNTYFFSDINIEKLILEIRIRINDLNPKYDADSCDYKLIFPNYLGYNDGNLTNALKVVTAIGTNRIITMYPILLSDEFNKEGNLENKRLWLKRKRGK